MIGCEQRDRKPCRSLRVAVTTPLGIADLVSSLAALRCRDLGVRFGDQADVLAELNCEFAAGEITSLVGPSGCGKTTLLRVLAGLQPVTDGRVEIDPPARSQAGELAFVFQQPTLLPWRTARDNVTLALELTGRCSSSQTARELAEQELRRMELPAAALDRFPRELSGGMRMRVSLARALVTSPKVLLLDEPFAALDDLSRSSLGDLLLRRWDTSPFTAVLVTHNIAEAALLSHRVFVLTGGRIAAELVDDLPRPRDESVRTSPQFGQFYARISAELHRPAAATETDRDEPWSGPRP